MRKPSGLAAFRAAASLLWILCALSSQVWSGETESRSLIERGKGFFNDKDYRSAIKTWSRALEEDPMNGEALSLIDEARFQADYEVAVLDRLKSTERVKSPHSSELSKIIEEMKKMLAKAKEIIRSQAPFTAPKDGAGAGPQAGWKPASDAAPEPTAWGRAPSEASLTPDDVESGRSGGVKP